MSNADRSQLSIYCAGCKHGYKATFNKDFQYQVVSCTLIDHCLPDGNMLNGCNECQNGYVLKYINEIDHSECI